MPQHFHVFNGDADGICSMVQLYRANPNLNATIITGRKRNINLLKDLNVNTNDELTVLDISMRSNADDVARLLQAGAKIFYADHHHPGNIPDHPNLVAHIDTSSETCTAVIVDDLLKGKYRAWAVTAAFGDNFHQLALLKADAYDFPIDDLKELGTLLNYNGYGASIEDLHFHPADLYREVRDFDTPMQFLAENPAPYLKLREGFSNDIELAMNAKTIDQTEKTLVIELADCASSRRVSGVYGNQLAQETPERAHAILTKKDNDAYVVSVRAPLTQRENADTLCLQFETGGGRSAAAGINHLPENELSRFVRLFRETYS